MALSNLWNLDEPIIWTSRHTYVEFICSREHDSLMETNFKRSVQLLTYKRHPGFIIIIIIELGTAKKIHSKSFRWEL